MHVTANDAPQQLSQPIGRPILVGADSVEGILADAERRVEGPLLANTWALEVADQGEMHLQFCIESVLQ